MERQARLVVGLRHLTLALGPELVSYLVHVDEDTDMQNLEYIPTDSLYSWAVLSDAIARVKDASLPFMKTRVALEALLERDPPFARSRFVCIAAGTAPPPQISGEPEDAATAFASLCNDMWPVMHAKPQDPHPFTAPKALLTQLMRGSPFFRSALDELATLPPIAAALESSGDDESTRFGREWATIRVSDSIGSGGHIHLGELLATMIMRAYAPPPIRDSPTSLIGPADAWDSLIAAVSGRPFMNVHLAGYKGLVLEAGDSISMPRGYLVSPDDLPPSFNQQVEGDRPTCVYVAHEPGALHLFDSDDPAFDGVWSQDGQAFQDQHERRRSDRWLMAIAIALATRSREAPLTLIPLSTMTLSPCSSDNRASPGFWPWLGQGSLDQQERQALGSWHEALSNADTSRISVAIERILDSLSGKQDETGAFIDAVIAMDALFGTDHNDRENLSKCGSAILEMRLNRDADESKLELQELYKARSKLSHGKKSGLNYDLHNLHRKALRTALEMLAFLLEDRPELLKNNAETRNKRVLAPTTPRQI